MSYSSLNRGEPTFLHQLDAPLRVVAHVVLVIDLAVEQLHADRDLLLLRVADDALQALGAILQAFFDRPCLRRLPEKTITFGRPFSAANSMCSRVDFSSRSWFFFSLKPSGIVHAPLSIAHVRPNGLMSLNLSGVSSSTD